MYELYGPPPASPFDEFPDECDGCSKEFPHNELTRIEISIPDLPNCPRGREEEMYLCPKCWAKSEGLDHTPSEELP